MKDLICKLFVCLVILFFSSCQKVIDVDLNSAAPQLVVEAEVSDQAGPYLVKLSQTVNFSATNTFPAVSGAVVKINDDAGNTETLKEFEPGNYYTSLLQGTPGRVYTLSIHANGKDYISTCSMPAPVNIDTLTIVTGEGFGGGGGSKRKSVAVRFKDPAGQPNYYRFVLIRSGLVQDNIYITDDRLQDGATITRTIRNRLFAGDSVVVNMECIDKGVNEYFRTFNQLNGAGEAQAASPANPISNISNGALGYFSAYSVRSKYVIVN